MRSFEDGPRPKGEPAPPGTTRWLIWLQADQAEIAQQYAKAARIYDQIVPLFEAAGLPDHAAFFAEKAKMCRQKANSKS